MVNSSQDASTKPTNKAQDDADAKTPAGGSTRKVKDKNTLIIVLLSILIVAVVGIGGYFVIADIVKNNSPDTSQNEDSRRNRPSRKSSNSNANTNNGTSNKESASTDSSSNGADTSTNTGGIEAGITYAEIRGDDFYIEAQANGAVEGNCVVSITPTDGSQGYTDTSDLDVHNKVSICDEDFSLRRLNSGQYLIRVVINAYDGRSTTLEQYVDL